MLLTATHLTFGEIAEEWAVEDVGKPFAQDREQILELFGAGLKNHEFDHAELTIEQAPKDVLIGAAPICNRSYVPQGKSWRPVTYDDLDKMLFRFCDERTKQLWRDGLRISEEHFRQWCDNQGHPRPRFWFYDEPAEPKTRPNQEARKRATGERNNKLQAAADKIWRQQWDSNQQLLTKQEVANSLFHGPDAAGLCRKTKGGNGGKLGADSIVRQIRVPGWVQKHRQKAIRRV